MNCGKIRRSIQAYVDGAAGRVEREAVDAHVARCEECSRVLADSRRLVSLLAGMPQRRVSEEFERNLATSLRHVAPVSRSEAWWERFCLRFEWRLRVPALVTAGSLAAGVIAAVVAPELRRPEVTPEQERLVASAVERHQQLERANPSSNWDAVDGSIELTTGSILTE